MSAKILACFNFTLLKQLSLLTVRYPPRITSKNHFLHRINAPQQGRALSLGPQSFSVQSAPFVTKITKYVLHYVAVTVTYMKLGRKRSNVVRNMSLWTVRRKYVKGKQLASALARKIEDEMKYVIT